LKSRIDGTNLANRWKAGNEERPRQLEEKRQQHHDLKEREEIGGRETPDLTVEEEIDTGKRDKKQARPEGHQGGGGGSGGWRGPKNQG